MAKTLICHAKRRLDDSKGLTDGEIAPGTKVHLLVEELAKYLPEEVKEKVI